MTGKPVTRVAALAISLVYRVIAPVLRSLGWESASGGPIVVLTYHGIGANDVATFEWQMQYLREHVRPVFPDSDASSSSDRQRVAVTFDDAFQSVIDRALPILERYEIPATIFVPTGYMGRLPGWVPEQKQRSLGLVASAETLGRLRSDLIRLGSHSVSHPRLGRLEKTALDTELTASRRALEGLGQEPVAMLALPYGSYARDVLEAASQAGYERVFANVPVAGERAGNSRLVGRVDVSPQDWPLEFKLKATGAYEWMSFALPVKRAIVGALSPQNAS